MFCKNHNTEQDLSIFRNAGNKSIYSSPATRITQSLYNHDSLKQPTPILPSSNDTEHTKTSEALLEVDSLDKKRGNGALQKNLKATTHLCLLWHEAHVYLLTDSYVLCAVQLHIVEQVVRTVCGSKRLSVWMLSVKPKVWTCWVNCSRISDSVIHKLLTVSEINICCFIFGFGLEVSNEGIHALKNKNALSNI